MKSKILGELEQRIMNILWEKGTPLSSQEVKVQLCDDHAYSTIVTVLTRLHNKGLLDRTKKGKAYMYFTIESKEDFANSKLKDLFVGIVDNYGDLAVSQFIGSIQDRPEELELLRKGLENIEKDED